MSDNLNWIESATPDPDAFDYFEVSIYSRTVRADGTVVENINGVITEYPPEEEKS